MYAAASKTSAGDRLMTSRFDSKKAVARYATAMTAPTADTNAPEAGYDEVHAESARIAAIAMTVKPPQTPAQPSVAESVSGASGGAVA